MGWEYVWTADEKTVCEVVRTAVDAGVNYFGLFVGTPTAIIYASAAIFRFRQDKEIGMRVYRLHDKAEGKIKNAVPLEKWRKI